MVRNKQPDRYKSEKKPSTIPLNKANTSITEFLSGSNAKWLFFGIYFLVTIFLFREFLFSNEMLFGNDTIPDGIYTRKYYKEYHEEYGGIPRWNPLVLGGLPFIDAMHGDTFYPAAWLKFVMPLSRALGHKLIWHVFLAGVFMYIYLRTLKFRHDASFLGGLMYMLAPSFVTLVYPAHDAKMYIIALLPLSFALLEYGMRTMRFIAFVGLGGVMGLLILTSHIQMAYYSYWALGLYFIFRLLTTGENKFFVIIRKASLFLLAVILALTLGAAQLLPSFTFTTTQSVRAGEMRTGYEYATSWSLHPEETAGMVIPSFSGFIHGSMDKYYKNLYWGKNPFKLNTEYHGILPILFAVMALVTIRKRFTWFLLGISLLSLIYALGANTPFYRLFYAFIPGVKNFRAPSMIIFLFCFAAVVMAAQFVSQVLENGTVLKKRDRSLLYTIGAIVLGTVVVTIMGQSFFDIWNRIFYRNIPENMFERIAANIPFFTRDLWRIAILACASLGGVWMFLARKISTFALVVLIAFVTFVDTSVVNNRFITVFDPERNPGTAPDRTVSELQQIMKNDEPFRILTFLSGKQSPNYYAMFGLQVADGLHNNELQSYELFRGGRNENYALNWIDRTVMTENIPQNNFLKVAGIRYIIIGTRNGNTVAIENESALKRAFIVHQYVLVESDTSAVSMLKDSSFDPAKTVIISGESAIPFTAESDSTGVSTLESLTYTKNGAIVNADFHSPGFLVLTDNWVPYWKAYIDGNPVRIHRAYGTFMAVNCPEGAHEITFMYKSSPYEEGKKMTLASMLFIAISILVTSINGIIKRKRKVT